MCRNKQFNVYISFYNSNFFTARCFAGELENGSLLLYIPRLRNRHSIYWAKQLTLHFAIVVVGIILVAVTLFCCYFLMVPLRADAVNGVFAHFSLFGAQIAYIMTIFCTFAITIQLVSCFATFPRGIMCRKLVLLWKNHPSTLPLLHYQSEVY